MIINVLENLKKLLILHFIPSYKAGVIQVQRRKIYFSKFYSYVKKHTNSFSTQNSNHKFKVWYEGINQWQK